jgi:excisionase family DNA binding protein
MGAPLSIREAARVIGCSPWTVRQKLMPRGLPHFRSGGGKLLFYTNQIIRWIESQQKGNV